MLMQDAETRRALWDRLIAAIESYLTGVGDARVTPELDTSAIAAIREALAPFDFEQPVAPVAALDFAVDSLWRWQVHTPHPRYFGLFNPATTPMGIAADALVAAFNPQLAAWSHSPLAAEVEQHLVRAFAGRFGFDPARTEGTFTSGGAEANHTALATALTRAFPETGRRGLLALRSQPILYVSPEAHHSFLKAARLSGLGTEAVREVRVDSGLRMIPEDLRARIREDREEGLAPFLVVATLGSTSAGVVDPIADLAQVADEEGVWLHADAAWGGAAALAPELRGVIAGISRASSITFDAHKWLSVPMGAGMFLTRHAGILERTFRVSARYMPREAATLGVADPYAHSMQWSRRFIGLKVFLSLAVAGWEGYAEAIRHQTAMGDLLRRRLQEEGWVVVNDTPLPVVCFVDSQGEGRAAAFVESVAVDVVGSGEAWISTVVLGEVGPALRACITNYRTGPGDVEALVASLGRARQRLGSRP
ncbi:MAG: aromatic-L-amino-acid/L-tryptophan decarboxylase [Acidobacteriota bacterium]|jgi:glutamate/tyrosine decarboxylase-like PLP-dependent enzyme|nr:aromatic-L-amino-acid/L-tryptophan decarboxylase [Acidobacteriota bacterium]